jgi:hypothetical protein
MLPPFLEYRAANGVDPRALMGLLFD